MESDSRPQPHLTSSLLEDEAEQDSSLDPMELALTFARAAKEIDEVPVGAVVLTDEGTLIGVGYNRRESDQDPTAHAEIMAIRDAAKRLNSWRLENCTLYVTLEPCPMCLGALQQSRIKHVTYGARDPKGGALSLGYNLHEDSRTNHRFEIDETLLPECGEILTQFFREKRNKIKQAPNSTDNITPQNEEME